MGRKNEPLAIHGNNVVHSQGRIVMEKEKFKKGAHVIYVDSLGRPQNGLVQIWHGLEGIERGNIPCCNILVLSLDELKEDTYGRQSEHYTSVVHKSSQPAHGFYWMWPDEVK